MSNKFNNGSDMYKHHRDLIASLLNGLELNESAEHPSGCRCKMCKPSIYEGVDEDGYPESWLDTLTRDECERLNKYHSMIEKGESLDDYYDDFVTLSRRLDEADIQVSETHVEPEDSTDHSDSIKKTLSSMCESDDEYIEKAKEEIANESDRALNLATEHGHLLSAVAGLNWFIQDLADTIRREDVDISSDEISEEKLEEKDLTMGVIDSRAAYVQHIANNFDHYVENIKRLYPQDQRDTMNVFEKFLKKQSIDDKVLEELSARLDKKIREVGDPYDEMATFIDNVVKFK